MGSAPCRLSPKAPQDNETVVAMIAVCKPMRLDLSHAGNDGDPRLQDASPHGAFPISLTLIGTVFDAHARARVARLFSGLVLGVFSTISRK